MNEQQPAPADVIPGTDLVPYVHHSTELVPYQPPQTLAQTLHNITVLPGMDDLHAEASPLSFGPKFNLFKILAEARPAVAPLSNLSEEAATASSEPGHASNLAEEEGDPQAPIEGHPPETDAFDPSTTETDVKDSVRDPAELLAEFLTPLNNAQGRPPTVDTTAAEEIFSNAMRNNSRADPSSKYAATADNAVSSLPDDSDGRIQRIADRLQELGSNGAELAIAATYLVRAIGHTAVGKMVEYSSELPAHLQALKKRTAERARRVQAMRGTLVVPGLSGVDYGYGLPQYPNERANMHGDDTNGENEDNEQTKLF